MVLFVCVCVCCLCAFDVWQSCLYDMCCDFGYRPRCLCAYLFVSLCTVHLRVMLWVPQFWVRRMRPDGPVFLWVERWGNMHELLLAVRGAQLHWPLLATGTAPANLGSSLCLWSRMGRGISASLGLVPSSLSDMASSLTFQSLSPEPLLSPAHLPSHSPPWHRGTPEKSRLNKAHPLL